MSNYKILTGTVLVVGLLAAACASSTMPEPQRTARIVEQPAPTAVADIQPVVVQISNLLEGRQEVEPGDPLVLRFSEPVSQFAQQPALSLFPQVEGSYTWNASADTLTFTPTGGFVAGQNYTAYLHPGLRGPRGEAMAVNRLDFSATAPPAVLRHTPGAERLSSRTPTIQVHFDRSMDRQSVAAALAVTPSVKLQLGWNSDSQQLTLSPEQPLEPGQRYRFSIGSDARDSRGVSLGSDYHWAYWLEGLQVEIRLPQRPGSIDPIELVFNYPISGDSVAQALQVEPPIQGSLEFHAVRSMVRLHPDRPLAPSTEYRFGFSRPIADPQGRPYPIPETQSVVSAAPIVSVLPEGSDWEEDVRTIEIEFERPMDPGTVERAFRIEPPVPGRFSWDGLTLRFRLEALLDYGQRYTVTIGSSALDAEGEAAFRVPYSWSFTPTYYHYGRVATFGSWGEMVQVVDAEGRRAIEFGAPCCDRVLLTFELHKLTTHQFAALAQIDPKFRQPRLSDVPGQTELARSWELAVDTRSAEGDLEQALIPDDVRPGLYLLRLWHRGRVETELAVALTSHTLAVKHAGREVTVWATDIHGDSLPGVEVRLFSVDGRIVREGSTDENGLYQTELAPGDQPLIVFGRTAAGGSAVAGFDSAWKPPVEIGGYDSFWMRHERQRTPKSYLAYVYTDRPIYRPGQTVHYKAIVREDLDAQYRLLPARTPITMRIRDGRDNLLASQQFTLNDFGSLYGEFLLDEEAGLGDYTLEVEVEGEAHRAEFKVQDYRKPDFRVHIATDRESYVVGDPIEISIEAEYFFGEPVTGATVTVRKYELGEFFGYWWEPAEAREQVEYVWYPNYSDQVSGTTDAGGNFSATLEAKLGHYSENWASWWSGLEVGSFGIEVTVDDGSRQTVSNFAVVKVHSSSERLWLDSGGYLWKPGSSVDLRFGAEDLHGEPVIGRTLELEVRRWQDSTAGYDRIVASQALSTGPDGSATVTVDNLRAGYYRLVVSNYEARGDRVQITRWLYVYEKGNPWARGEAEQPPLAISADRDRYTPYQRASLIIETELGGPALLSFERGSLLRQQVIQLTPPITTLEVPILASDAPNVFVTVSAWQPQSTSPTTDQWVYTNLPASRLRSASVELQVDTSGRELQVEIESDQEAYGPGDTAQIRLQVSRTDGTPVHAEVSLALVDEAIFSLSQDTALPILQAFYGRRANAVQTYSSMAPYREIYPPGRGGGGGGDILPGNLRSEFEDVAAWYPELRTDSNGELVVSLSLPDNLTSWRIVARAVTRDTRVGESTLNLITRKPLVVRPILPRNLTAGDSLTLTGLVHNFTAEQLQVEVLLEAPGLQIEGGTRRSIALEPGELAAVGWAVRAPEAGDYPITVSARGDGLADAVRLPLSVQPLAIPDLETRVGSITGEWTTQLLLPQDASPLSSVTLELDRSISGTVLSGLEFLTGFPYGCVEQIMSKALPNAVVGRAAAQLGNEPPADLERKVNQGLQKLYAMQHADGGWGWWYDDRSHDYQTAWVLFGLAITSEAGYLVENGAIQRAADYLRENLNSMDPRTRAYALYAMALAGHPDRETTLVLADQSFGLDPFSRAALAMALHRMGETHAARSLLSQLELEVRTVGEQAYWPSSEEEGHYYRKTMASDVRNTAMVLDSLVAIDPESELIDGAVRWLVAQRRRDGWGTTNETAFAILALTDYTLAQETAAGSVNYRVELNGAPYAQGVLEPGAGSLRIEIPADELDAGLNQLTVGTSSATKLYYSLSSRIIRPLARLDPSGIVGIERTYYDLASQERIAWAAAGQVVGVRLRVQMPVDGYFVLIEDRLPGGLEAINEALNSSSHEITDWGEPIYHWEELGYNYKEVRADRVSFFVSELLAGSHTFNYVARATHSGSFTALPAEAYAMYELSLWGRSGSSVLQIGELSTADQPPGQAAAELEAERLKLKLRSKHLRSNSGAEVLAPRGSPSLTDATPR